MAEFPIYETEERLQSSEEAKAKKKAGEREHAVYEMNEALDRMKRSTDYSMLTGHYNTFQTYYNWLDNETDKRIWRAQANEVIDYTSWLKPEEKQSLYAQTGTLEEEKPGYTEPEKDEIAPYEWQYDPEIQSALDQLMDLAGTYNREPMERFLEASYAKEVPKGIEQILGTLGSRGMLKSGGAQTALAEYVSSMDIAKMQKQAEIEQWLTEIGQQGKTSGVSALLGMRGSEMSREQALKTLAETKRQFQETLPLTKRELGLKESAYALMEKYYKDLESAQSKASSRWWAGPLGTGLGLATTLIPGVGAPLAMGLGYLGGQMGQSYQGYQPQGSDLLSTFKLLGLI